MSTQPMLHRALAATFAASALFAAAIPAAHADPQRADPTGPRLQAILDHSVGSPKRSFPGVAFYVRRPGHRTWTGAAGKADINAATPMRPGARFRAGSIMKTFVAATTLQLAEEGRIGLDAPMTAVLPPNVTARFADADAITIRMLLNHTSGLAEYTDAAFDREVAADPQRRWKVGELLDRSASQPRTGAPGERFSYSNTDYNLLGLVIEQVTGRSWRSVVRRRVFDRLHLSHTSLPEPGRHAVGSDIAHGYQVVDGKVYDLTDVDSSMAGAAGGNALLTTDADLSRFLRGLLAGKLFAHSATLKQMLTFVPAVDEHGKVGYGLGLERYVLPGGVEMVGHMGTGAGYRAFMFRLPKQHIDFAMVTNTPGDPMPVLIPALKLLVG